MEVRQKHVQLSEKKPYRRGTIGRSELRWSADQSGSDLNHSQSRKPDLRVVSESYCTEKKIADSVYQIWRKSGQRNSVPDIVAEFINRGHDFKTSLMAGF